ncbi:hypothetical protein J3R80_09255 [Aliiroseovarius sp. Z3]|uniref:hypothetical protein n=1 Tax=Aliiroseovarius sp. Z3 TaxID=2811402 RepID=UPI0023B2BB90|nr:hypothetical protein [Aliiroseovarius sp. Z3]MDE9450648.1 hypothetical protein [Aliiroseovarius sp. Z3]
MNRFLRDAAGIIALLVASPSIADEWKTRPGDTRLDQTELSNTVSGQTLTFYDGATSVFNLDGTYSYTYGGGGTWLGDYKIGTDSTACILFVTGVSRCDLYIVNNDQLVLITKDGLRFPVQSITQH